MERETNTELVSTVSRVASASSSCTDCTYFRGKSWVTLHSNKKIHVSHVKQVLKDLWENKLDVKKEKWEFHVTQIRFLGYAFNTEGVIMDQGKVTAVQDWPTWTTVKELQCFVSSTIFYHQFIRGFNSIANERIKEAEVDTRGRGAEKGFKSCPDP